MDFLTSTILSGIIYDILKKGMELSISNVFALKWIIAYVRSSLIKLMQ